MHDFLRFKNGPFMPLLFVISFFELPCTSVPGRILCTALCKNKHFTFNVLYGDHTYQVPVPGIYSKQQFSAGTPIVPLYENGDAVRIEPRPPSNTCRFCARSSRTLFRPQASGYGTRMQVVLGESRASCRLSIRSRVGSNSGSQQQQYEGLVDNSCRWLTHPPHLPPPDAVPRVRG